MPLTILQWATVGDELKSAKWDSIRGSPGNHM